MQIFRTVVPLVLTALLSSMQVQAQAVGSITCDNGGPNSIQASDWTALADAFSNGNVGGQQNPILLSSVATKGKPSSANEELGTIRIDLNNPFLFSSTHVSFSAISAALRTVQAQCCGGFSKCIGGSTKVAGDTGLAVDLTIKPN